MCLATAVATVTDYLDYVPGIGNARFIWIIRVGAHPNNSWSALETTHQLPPLFAS